MTMVTPKKTTVAKAGGKGATKAVRTRTARRAVKPAAKAVRSRTARRAVKPAAKAGWFVGKKVAKRKVSGRARRYGEAARTARSAALIYGPMVAEVLGLVEQPKPARRLPAFLTGVAVGAGLGAGLMYLAGRNRTG